MVQELKRVGFTQNIGYEQKKKRSLLERSGMLSLQSLPESEGGADLSLVRLGKDGKPECVRHGAMNKLSPVGIWRCISTTGTNGRRCDAGCYAN